MKSKKVAIIMAAGLGSRLAPITNKKPKSMVKVNGLAMIDNILLQANKLNFDETRVVIGYEAKVFENHLKKNFPNVTIIHNRDYETTNNLYSFLMGAKDIKDSDVLFMNSDLFFENGFLKDIVRNNYSVIATKIGEWNDENMKVIEKSGILKGISKQFNVKESFGISCDTYWFKKDDFSKFLEIAISINKENNNAWTEVAIDKFLKASKVKPYDVSNKKWFEIDTLEDLENASILFNNNEDIFEKYDNYIFDLDGTLYKDGKLINEKSVKIFNKLVKEKNVFVLTNNSTKSRIKYADILQNLGFNVKKNMVINSTVSVIEWLKSKNVSNVYCFGTKDFKKQVWQSGIKIVENLKNAKVIIVGNNRYFDTYELDKIILEIQKRHVPVIATNPDLKYPLADGRYAIDTGLIVKLIEMATGEKIKILGKPSKDMLNFINHNKSILFGDRIYTDIACANSAGISSALVLSGESSIVDYEDTTEKINYILKNIG